MRKNKKGQFIVLSTLSLLLLLLFIHSIETQNSYITSFGQKHILENIKYETCQVGYLSNGSQINSRFGNLSTFVTSYCNEFQKNCSLTITNTTPIPPSGNWSLLNYSHYSYELMYNDSELYTNLSFQC